MKLNLTPWARAALGPEHIQRLRLHLTGTKLTVIGPAPWVIRIFGAPGQSKTWEMYYVSTPGLWPSIVAGLAECGVPLPSDEEWQEIRADIEADERADRMEGRSSVDNIEGDPAFGTAFKSW